MGNDSYRPPVHLSEQVLSYLQGTHVGRLLPNIQIRRFLLVMVVLVVGVLALVKLLTMSLLLLVSLRMALL